MVVEDESIVALALKRQLEMVGLDVVGTAATEESAVAAAREHLPDLILMDINLEEAEDGIRAAKRINTELDIPIVYLSAYSDDETIRRANEAEAYGYVLKPFRGQALVAAITTALHRHRRHNERLLERQQQNMLTRVLETLPDGVIIFDDDYQVQSMNPAATEIFARPAPPTTLSELIPKAALLDRKHHIATLDQESRQDGHESTALNLRVQLVEGQRSDGSIFPAEVTLFLFPSLRTQHGVAIVRDLSAVRRREREQARALKLEAMGRLSSIMAHDFNNLLGGLQLQAEQMLASYPDPDNELHRPLNAIVSTVEHGRALTSRLADLTRSRSTSREWTDVGASLGRMLGFVGRILGDEIQLDWRIGESLGSAQLSEAELVQIVMNAATNARAAMPKGGTFSLRATAEEASDPDSQTHWICMELEDTGQGMSAESAEHAFDPFFTTKGGAGSGLGLASIRILTEEAGGMVELSSTPNQGTIVTVRLPATIRPAQASDYPAAPLPKTASDLHRSTLVLIVDDNELIRDALEVSLENAGYTCLCASSVGQALTTVQERGAQIGLMLTDVAMPMLNGVELCKIVLQSCPNIATILMTGNAHRDLQVPPELGIPRLLKPFKIAELEQAIEQALSHQEAR